MLKFLIVGFGSIGKRHFNNLRQIGGAEVSLLTGQPVSPPDTRLYRSPAETLDQKFDAVFITNETALHVPTAIAFAERGNHLFLEKPVSDSLEGIDKLTSLVKKNNLKVMVGYNMRFHPVVKAGKDLVREGRIGPIISARIAAGQYLPDWHPGEDYRRSYSASRERGGGVILDLSHELDYTRWFFGDASRIFSLIGRRSDLEIETEDNAEILLEFKGGTWCQIHLDYLQRPPERLFRLVGTRGIIEADLIAGKLRVAETDKTGWEEVSTNSDFQSNDMYLEEIKSFMDYLGGAAADSPVSLADGIKVLQTALAAKESARTGAMVPLPEDGLS